MHGCMGGEKGEEEAEEGERGKEEGGRGGRGGSGRQRFISRDGPRNLEHHTTIKKNGQRVLSREEKVSKKVQIPEYRVLHEGRRQD